MRYPNTLRQHREARGLTQWHVAKDNDIHINRYGRMEAGKTQPSYAEAMRLGAYFAQPAGVLFPVVEHAAA